MLAYPGDPSGAMTVIDPRTGYVRAMVGGKDADYWDATSGDGRVNLATGGSTGRQAGSSFKPFALVAALENGISPSTVFPAPSSIEIPLDNGTVWDVSNAEPSSYGSLTLEQATISSVNTVYAQLINLLGAQTVVDVAKRMGIRCCQRVSEPKRPLLPYLSAVLGTNEVNTLEMTSAYGTLAAGGQHVNPVPVISIAAADGAPVWQASPKPRQVVEPAVAAAANDILQKVVLYGTGTAANIGRPQIGKTGTNQNYADAWFVGAIPQLVAGGLGGVPTGADLDVRRLHAHHGLRRDVAGADLASVHGEGGGRPPGARVPDARRELRGRRGRRDAEPVLPPEPIHAAPEHPDAGVHRGHGADADVHGAHVVAGRSRCRPWWDSPKPPR